MISDAVTGSVASATAFPADSSEGDDINDDDGCEGYKDDELLLLLLFFLLIFLRVVMLMMVMIVRATMMMSY